MMTVISESQKDDMTDPFIKLCKQYSKGDHRFYDLLQNTKADCFKDLYKIMLEYVDKYTLPISYVFTQTYKAWCGIIFRAKCLDISCAYMMHPFDYLNFTGSLSKDQIVEYLGTSKTWKSCCKQCKAIKANSMVSV